MLCPMYVLRECVRVKADTSLLRYLRLPVNLRLPSNVAPWNDRKVAQT